jgi:prophage tail gpP-like protein
MPRPVAGQQYTIVEGDTLSKIAGIVYGDINKWPIINKANLTQFRSGDPDLIYPGEVIWIPPKDFLQFPSTLPNKDENDLTIVVDGIEIPLISARVIRTMNTASDAWVATIAWNPGDDEAIDKATRPFAYPLAAAYIGGDLKVGGILYDVEVSVNNNGRVKNLYGFSFTADAIDSNLKPPYEANKISLKTRATDLLNPLGIGVEFQDEIVTNAGILGDIAFTPAFKAETARLNGEAVFSRVTASSSDTIFGHLASLAAQRKLLLSSDSQGNVVFLQANTNGSSIGSIEEEPDTFAGLGALEYTAMFSGRGRFRSYKVLTKTPNNNGAFAVSKDNNVPRPRFKNIQGNDIIEGEAQAVADWQKNTALAKSLATPFPVSTWYGPDGNLWQENTLLTVKSPTLSIDEGYTFLIQKVEFIYETSGIRAILSLVPPQVYSGEEIIEPWAG